MRSRLSFFVPAILAGTALVPFAAHAASFPFFGAIVPANIETCAAGWAGFTLVLNNLLAFAITILVVFIAPLFIAWAGFLYVVSPANPSNRGKANKILINTIVGIIIALAAWLIVDFLLIALTSPSKGVSDWTSELFSGGDTCLNLTPQSVGTLVDTSTGATTGVGLASNSGIYGTSGAQCSSDNTACSVATLESLGMTPAQANVMSCIAVTESSGNPNTAPYNVAHPGSNSTACGTFQVVQKTWKGAATGACSDFSNCQSAACNAQVAVTLVSQSGYSSWTCPGCNNKAAGCVSEYGAETETAAARNALPQGL